MRTRLSTLLAFAVISSCGLQTGPDGQGGGAGGAAGGGTGGGSAAAGDLPCDVAQLLNDSCLSCHGSPLTQGATVRLLSLSDLKAPSAQYGGQTVAQRCLARLEAGTMPPAPATVASARVAAFRSWVNAGTPAGTCGAGGGAGGGNGDSGGGAGGGSGSGGSGGAGGGSASVSGLPCDVAAVVQSRCVTCHANPPTGGATVTLLSRADFLAASTVNPAQTNAQRSAERMQASSNPMPPVGNPAATAAEITTFVNWVNAGTPAGACGSVDGGTPTADAGVPATPTCATGQYWAGGNNGNADMNPGKPCKACHATQAFFKNYAFMGTVYPSLHEKDLCDASPPTGIKLEIIDKTGAVAETIYPDATSGNFHSALFINLVQLPYTARLTANGRTATMTTPQQDGDCNGCHTVQGANGATGRIVWP